MTGQQRRVGRNVAGALALVVALAACSASPSGRPFGTVLRFADDGAPFPVTLSDETGLVTGIEPAAMDLPPDHLQTRADPGDPNAFIVSWLGGACDSDAALTFSMNKGTYLLNVAVHEKFSFGGGCPAVGIPRVIRIVTSAPVPADAIVAAGST